MVDFESKSKYDVYDLKKLIAVLRAPGGCPWDAEQTHESIRRNMLEEAYECCEAIDEKSAEHLCEELGDVLLQVVLHSQMEDELGVFDLDGVADMVCKKLILRHPHVFGGGMSAEAAGAAFEKIRLAMTVDAAQEKEGPHVSSLPLMVTKPAGASSEISASSHRFTSATAARASASGSSPKAVSSSRARMAVRFRPPAADTACFTAKSTAWPRSRCSSPATTAPCRSKIPSATSPESPRDSM